MAACVGFCRNGSVMASKRVINLLILLVVTVLSLDFTYHVVVEGARSSLSVQEDLELERQLKILNKPPIKTIHTEWGDIHDCIDVHKQPAFDHPLLKNHKIQMKPSSVSKRVRDETSSAITKRHKTLNLRTPVEGCPKGTVPIRRTRKEDLIRAKSLSLKTIQSGSKANAPNEYVSIYNAGLDYSSKGETFYGATAYINVYNPNVTQDQYSSAEIALKSGPDDLYNQIKFGWTVNPQLYGGDKSTRAFIYWTSDGAHSTGCYNTLCPGFVQVHETYTPSTPFANTSTFGGTQYEAQYTVYLDREKKQWWLVYQGNINVGYWPNELFPLFTAGAEYIYWGGHVKAGGDGISPQMGSGHLPDGYYDHACYFAEMQYKTESGELLNPQEKKMDGNQQCEKFYGLKYYGFQKDKGHSFLFGGPGGKCA
ncbi:protein of unknown function DUF239 [Macleaya cordata]|uniref:Neprosin PEP catalytic domain-containing protein n=1 Tax=Macleaya cordata TaxID=56857 RepID=A0A200PSP8_MACCD|nr:protein of unknown function DUF239 [Macleaya cordata]